MVGIRFVLVIDGLGMVVVVVVPKAFVSVMYESAVSLSLGVRVPVLGFGVEGGEKALESGIIVAMATAVVSSVIRIDFIVVLCVGLYSIYV